MAFSDYFAIQDYNWGGGQGQNSGSLEDLSTQIQNAMQSLVGYGGQTTPFTSQQGPPSQFTGAIPTELMGLQPAANFPAPSSTRTITRKPTAQQPTQTYNVPPIPHAATAGVNALAQNPPSLPYAPGQSPNYLSPTPASDAAVAQYRGDDLNQLYDIQNQLFEQSKAAGNANPSPAQGGAMAGVTPNAQQQGIQHEIGSLNQLINQAYAQDVANTRATYAGYGVAPLGSGATEDQVLQATVMQPQTVPSGWNTQGSILTTPSGNTIDLSKLSANDAYHRYSGEVWAAWKQWNAANGNQGGLPNPFSP